jgi:pimeloyl-ACP methyl ester carboxylesterase
MMTEPVTEELRIPTSDGFELEGHLARPTQSPHGSVPGVLLLHGFPSGAIWAEHIGADLPELASRCAQEMGWVALALRFRGCGSSTGDFSLAGWVEDVRAGLSALRSIGQPDQVWVCGFGTGGSVGLVASADDEDVAGVAMVGSPADFEDWSHNNERLLAHAHQVGAIKDPRFPTDFAGWKSELSAIRAVDAAERLAPRPLMLLHGGDDDIVPQVDARIVAEAHGAGELRLISGAGHLLRHDPRAIAVLLGWLVRSRNIA